MKVGPSAKLIDGRSLADEIQHETKKQIEKLGIRPGLAVILAGNNPASELYVSLKQKAARAAGIMFSLYKFEEDAKESEILETIGWLNNDPGIDAILIQLPLPKHINEAAIIKCLDPDKDADGFHPKNIEKLLAGQDILIPGLHLGLLQLLAATGTELADKKALVIAKSPEFTATLLYVLGEFGLQAETKYLDDPDLAEKEAEADVIITAVGKPGFIKGGDIKKGAILIDVGTTRLPDNTTAGDVDMESCSQRAAWITPVPGGVGPMTVAMLLKSTVALAARHNIPPPQGGGE